MIFWKAPLLGGLLFMLITLGFLYFVWVDPFTWIPASRIQNKPIVTAIVVPIGIFVSCLGFYIGFDRVKVSCTKETKET